MGCGASADAVQELHDLRVAQEELVIRHRALKDEFACMRNLLEDTAKALTARDQRRHEPCDYPTARHVPQRNLSRSLSNPLSLSMRTARSDVVTVASRSREETSLSPLAEKLASSTSSRISSPSFTGGSKMADIKSFLQTRAQNALDRASVTLNDSNVYTVPIEPDDPNASARTPRGTKVRFADDVLCRPVENGPRSALRRLSAEKDAAASHTTHQASRAAPSPPVSPSFLSVAPRDME
eukprot:TRINITY_DN5507_c0_g1_i1.p1 TRINITY_DN5507_c0_g1~~TRINITY_DN5507_c0_g1_i1.p1  ORF type:complete len:239 (+),score=40.48 TRINITY_DN5507_c0_g1_i1:74-790(+)